MPLGQYKIFNRFSLLSPIPCLKRNPGQFNTHVHLTDSLLSYTLSSVLRKFDSPLKTGRLDVS